MAEWKRDRVAVYPGGPFLGSEPGRYVQLGEMTTLQYDTSQRGGCDECNRTTPKPWPIYTVKFNGTEVCAKCLVPLGASRG